MPKMWLENDTAVPEVQHKEIRLQSDVKSPESGSMPGHRKFLLHKLREKF